MKKYTDLSDEEKIEAMKRIANAEAQKREKEEREDKILMMKNLIMAELRWIEKLLEEEAEKNLYNHFRYRSNPKASELFKKMHELRRDTTAFEKLVRGN